jgi:hypothetical protein
MPDGRTSRLILWSTAAALAALTVLPGDWVWRPLGLVSCLACGSLATVDAIHNLLFFVPVGAVLTERVRRPTTAVLIAGLLSACIELLQATVVPDRVASWQDVVLNIGGAAGGATLVAGGRWWLSPTRMRAWFLSLGSASVFAAILVGTGYLAHPSPIPPDRIFGQWAPRRQNFDPFLGRVTSLAVNGVPVNHGLVEDQEGLRAAWRVSPAVIRLDAIAPNPDGGRPRLVARIVAVDKELLLFAQKKDAFLTRVRLRAADYGLRSPIFKAGAEAGRDGQTSVELVVDDKQLATRVSTSSGISTGAVALDVTIGWAFVLPVELALGNWVRVASGIWIAILALPTGLFLAASRDGGPRKWLMLMPVLVLCAGLGLAPALVSVHHSHWSAWAASAFGVWAGWRLCLRVERAPGGWHNGRGRPSL